MQARIALLEQENAEFRAQEAAQTSTKKRRTIPNPNQKFMSIHEILSKGESVEDLKENLQVEEEAEKELVAEEEDIYGVSDEEQNAQDEAEIPGEVITRSGRAVNKPARYMD